MIDPGNRVGNWRRGVVCTPALSGGASNALRDWTLSCVCFQSPEGRKQNSPGLQPWERDTQRNRPERASELELAINEEYVVTIFDGPGLFAPNCARSLPPEMPSNRFRKTLFLEIRRVVGRPFRAILFPCAFPGLKPWAVLSSPFARIATPARQCANCSGRCMQHPSDVHQDRSRLGSVDE
jgi:hypothetical protein